VARRLRCPRKDEVEVKGEVEVKFVSAAEAEVSEEGIGISIG